MLNTMKAMYFESQFLFKGGRGLLAIFTNPFYFVRKNLYANIEPYCLLRTPRMAGTIKPGGVDNERKTI